MIHTVVSLELMVHTWLAVIVIVTPLFITLVVLGLCWIPFVCIVSYSSLPFNK
jgi:hypothetical protein